MLADSLVPLGNNQIYDTQPWAHIRMLWPIYWMKKTCQISVKAECQLRRGRDIAILDIAEDARKMEDCVARATSEDAPGRSVLPRT